MDERGSQTPPPCANPSQGRPVTCHQREHRPDQFLQTYPEPGTRTQNLNCGTVCTHGQSTGHLRHNPRTLRPRPAHAVTPSSIPGVGLLFAATVEQVLQGYVVVTALVRNGLHS